MNGIVRVPAPVNEPVLSYAPGSPERAALKRRLAEMANTQIEIPLVIGGQAVRTGKTGRCVSPHDHGRTLATYHQAGRREVEQAIAAAATAWREWSETPWEARAAVLLKAADLLAGLWRDTEIDAACELVDFWRFNAHFAQEIYAQQPVSTRGFWNMVDYRPLEGFVFAVTPFNFTAIGGNLSTSPALMGNTVLWKPASTSILSNHYILQILIEAGLPPGVVNFIPGRGGDVGDPVFASPGFAGLHFTGSTETFQAMWNTRPAARTSSSRILRPTSKLSPWRWCAALSSTRGRSAPRPRGATSRSPSGRRSRSASWPRWRLSAWARRSTSATSWRR